MAGSERKKSPHCERVDGEDRMVRDHSGLWEWRAIPADSQLENEDGIPTASNRWKHISFSVESLMRWQHWLTPGLLPEEALERRPRQAITGLDPQKP